MLRVRSVSKTYPGAEAPALDGVSLALDAGRTLALTGESGSGKSTLLHLIAGLEAADAGEIEVAGARLSQAGDAARAALRRDAIGIVFQQFNLIPSLDARDNLAFQARLAGRLDPAWQTELTERLGLGALLRRYPEELSGGQQQRVAIARALVKEPALVLADEPTANLDRKTGEAILADMRRMNEERGATFLFSTHDPMVIGHCRRVLHVEDGLVQSESHHEPHALGAAT